MAVTVRWSNEIHVNKTTMAGMEKAVKKRKPNWSMEESLLLVNAVRERRLIINGRFRPDLTTAAKRRAWDEVTMAINAAHPHTVRTKEEVETKWFALLSKSRRKIASERREFDQSGENYFTLLTSKFRILSL